MDTAKSQALPLVKRWIERAARAYTAGPALDNAHAVCDQCADRGLRSIVCYWNVAYDQPAQVAGFYSDILGLIPELHTDCYLSVKAPAIQFNAQFLKRILELARPNGTVVHFDAMGPETAEDTFAMIATARSLYSKLGCTLPARWHRSLRDADRAIEMGLRVRVVKGQWADSKPVDVDPVTGYLDIIDRLGAGRAVHVAVATHDAKLAHEALSRLRTTGTPCELELLYGLPVQPVLKVARALDVPARLYVPYGHAALPYGLRQAARKPQVLRWFIRDLWRGTRPSLHKPLPHPSRFAPI
jgi:proline dehydrogenase